MIGDFLVRTTFECYMLCSNKWWKVRITIECGLQWNAAYNCESTVTWKAWLKIGECNNTQVPREIMRSLVVFSIWYVKFDQTQNDAQRNWMWQDKHMLWFHFQPHMKSATIEPINEFWQVLNSLQINAFYLNIAFSLTKFGF